MTTKLWYITGKGEVGGGSTDKRRTDFLGCYETREEAERARNFIKRFVERLNAKTLNLNQGNGIR